MSSVFCFQGFGDDEVQNPTRDFPDYDTPVALDSQSKWCNNDEQGADFLAIASIEGCYFDESERNLSCTSNACVRTNSNKPSQAVIHCWYRRVEKIMANR
jgi:hypothetical protein